MIQLKRAASIQHRVIDGMLQVDIMAHGGCHWRDFMSMIDPITHEIISDKIESDFSVKSVRAYGRGLERPTDMLDSLVCIAIYVSFVESGLPAYFTYNFEIDAPHRIDRIYCRGMCHDSGLVHSSFSALSKFYSSFRTSSKSCDSGASDNATWSPFICVEDGDDMKVSDAIYQHDLTRRII